jgi:hypothetical protein
MIVVLLQTQIPHLMMTGLTTPTTPIVSKRFKMPSSTRRNLWLPLISLPNFNKSKIKDKCSPTTINQYHNNKSLLRVLYHQLLGANNLGQNIQSKKSLNYLKRCLKSLTTFIKSLKR